MSFKRIKDETAEAKADALANNAELIERLGEYIDENYVPDVTEAAEYGSPAERQPGSARAGLTGSRRGSALYKRHKDSAFPDSFQRGAEKSLSEALPEVCEDAEAVSCCEEMKSIAIAPDQDTASLEHVVNNLGESFQARLLRMIDERGMTDPEVYRRAHVDRKLFSKIRCSEDYIPKKKTIVALALALGLDLDDTNALLASAGLTLTNNSKADVIVRFCIENGIYDMFEVNSLLFRFGQPAFD